MKTRWIQQACDLLCSLVVLLLCFLFPSFVLETKCTRDQIYPLTTEGNEAGAVRQSRTVTGSSGGSSVKGKVLAPVPNSASLRGDGPFPDT